MIAETISTGALPDPIPGEPVAFGERLTCSVDEACKAVGLSRSKIYELISGGEVQSVTIGRRRLVNVSSLMRLTGNPQERPGVPALPGRR